MFKCTLFFFAVLLLGYFVFFSEDVCAQVQKTVAPAPNGVFFKSVCRDTRDLLLFPKEVKKSDHLFLGNSIILLPAAFMFDEPVEKILIKQRFRRENQQWLDYSVSNFGNGLYPGITAVILYGVGLNQERNDLKWLALLQLKTIGLAAGASRIPKFLFQRSRPSDAHPVNSGSWSGPFHGFSGNYSFPSGHTFIAFSWAAASASALKGEKGLVAGFYGVATLVGLSRLYKGDHWTSDVIAGALMGYALGKLTYRIQERNWMKKPQRKKSFPSN